jgi:hypothetical protein
MNKRNNKFEDALKSSFKSVDKMYIINQANSELSDNETKFNNYNKFYLLGKKEKKCFSSNISKHEIDVNRNDSEVISYLIQERRFLIDKVL